MVLSDWTGVLQYELNPTHSLCWALYLDHCSRAHKHQHQVFNTLQTALLNIVITTQTARHRHTQHSHKILNKLEKSWAKLRASWGYNLTNNGSFNLAECRINHQLPLRTPLSAHPDITFLISRSFTISPHRKSREPHQEGKQELNWPENKSFS